MLCYKCNENNLLLDFENYILLNKPSLFCEFNQIVEEYFEYNEKIGECDNCKSLVDEDMVFVENSAEFYDALYELISSEVMKTIVCCTECGEGSDIKGLYPSIKSCFYDKDDDPVAIFDSFDTAKTLEELLNEMLQNNNDSWEPYYNEIVEYIQCPRCDNGSGIDMREHINNGTFDLNTEIYTQRDIDAFNQNFYGDSVDKINDEISKIAKRFSMEELIELKEKFSANKLFIYAHPAFAKLHDLIKGSAIVYILGSKRIVFRARPYKDGHAYHAEEMWEAPRNFVGQGRYNDNGEVVLYCSNNRETIKKEVPSDSGRHTIGVFQVEKPMVLLPINYLFGRHFEGLISEEVSFSMSSYKSKEQYIITNIVSAIAKDIGYKGIAYISTKDKFSVNYALFNYEKDTDLKCFCTLNS